MSKCTITVVFLTFLYLNGITFMPSFVDDISKLEPNPHKYESESGHYWRYDLFEIFRDAETVNFDDTLEYEQNYSYLIPAEEGDFSDILHEYKCQITLPQTTTDNPWSEEINTYYQNIIA